MEEAAVLGWMFDISARREMEDQARENEQRLLDVLNGSPIAVRIATEGGRKVVFHNRAYVEITWLASPASAALGQLAVIATGTGCGHANCLFPSCSPALCWVHKMRNILEKARKRGYDAVKTDAQAIYIGRQPPPGRGRCAQLLQALAGGLCQHSAATGARPTGDAGLPSFSQAPGAQASHHQPHRAMFRRSSPPYPPRGLLRQRAVRGPNHLPHLPEIQPGMEKPHPPRIYTGGLTSPGAGGRLTNPAGVETIRELHSYRTWACGAVWERASMAWKRSSVRSRPGPPINRLK